MLRDLWIIIGLSLVALLAIEVTIRSFGRARVPRDSRASADGYADAIWAAEYFHELAQTQTTRWKPYVYWRRVPFRGRFIQVDDEGHRVTSEPGAAVAGTGSPFEVFAFGGSTMWGTGARDAYTIPSLIAEGLAGTGVRPEVTNFAETGYVSTQSLIELMLQLRAGNVPDLVIFYDGINDAFAAYQSGEAGIPQNEANRIREFNVLNASRRPEMAPLLFGALQRTATYDLLTGFPLSRPADGDGLSSPDFSPTSPTRALAAAVVRTYVGNLKTVRALATAYGFDALFFWQPSIFDKPHLSDYEREQRDRWQNLRPFFEQVHAEIDSDRGALASEGFVDLSDAFRETRVPVFIDYGHLTEDGNRVVADRMLVEILVRLQD